MSKVNEFVPYWFTAAGSSTIFLSYSSSEFEGFMKGIDFVDRITLET